MAVSDSGLIVDERVSKIRKAVEFIRARCSQQPALGLVLGSGLGACADLLTDRIVISFSDLPNFPLTKVVGHTGRFIIGNIEGVPAIALQGRVHLYEGYSISEVVFPIRVLGCLGIRQLIVTNAAGGIDKEFNLGDLMLITDHINFTGANPLIGANIDEFGPQFPDMSEAYDSGLRKIALEIARLKNIPLREGVYIAFSGPNYETPAEIRMCRALGADAVGMSTVPEVIAARHMGIRVLGISCITNMAAGILPQLLTHSDVLDTAERAQGKLQTLLQAIIGRLGACPRIRRHRVPSAAGADARRRDAGDVVVHRRGAPTPQMPLRRRNPKGSGSA
jgi:purine-nucleoside phosphorylase